MITPIIQLVLLVMLAVALWRYWTKVAQLRLHKARLKSSEEDNMAPIMTWELTHGLILTVGVLVGLGLLAALVSSV